jgi:hypothetical protein
MRITTFIQAVGLALPLAAVFAGSAAAIEFYEAPRAFVIDLSCDAYRSVKRKAEPIRLEVGKRYVGRGVDRRRNAMHAFIRVGSESRWVALACGHYADGDGAMPGPAIPGKLGRARVRAEARGRILRR